MIRHTKHIAVSVRNRLLQISRDLNVDFNRILLLYVQERFLNRLSVSKYGKNFVLKGGVLFYGIHRMLARPTKDIDFLVNNLKNNLNTLNSVISEIIELDIQDGLRFDRSSIAIEEISEDAEYNGLRIKVTAFLEQAKINLQIDLGFGDIVLPEPVQFQYPSILDDQAFTVNGYSLESVIAEKFEAIVKLSDINSRMKDFYDIFFVMQHHDFDGSQLKESLAATFNNRKTDLKYSDYIFLDEFADSEEKKKQWQAFLKKSGIGMNDKFCDVMSRLENFIEPVVIAIRQQEEFKKKWIRSEQKWQS